MKLKFSKQLEIPDVNEINMKAQIKTLTIK